AQGYALPDYPDDPKSDEERDIRARYDKVKGPAPAPSGPRPLRALPTGPALVPAALCRR
ncbi:NADP-dependent isocitrate dehydrogenase, partial [Streptomyces sp. NPDC005386]|uniref:NADP-dependent isocitrate dehydrogenase n=1 Tax=Streptomyces sp. NPDC005386 TaxID=3154562 RepID=UPI0033AC3CF0